MKLEIKTRSSMGRMDSPDIVFVHGAWHAAWCWEENFMNFFAQHGFTNHALSLRGHGSSFGHDRLSSTRIKDYVDDLVSFTQSLKSSPILIGHSMGGFIIQKYLENYEAHAVVLLASLPHSGILDLNLEFAACHPLLYFRMHIRRSLKVLLENKNYIRDSFFSETLDENKIKQYFNRMGDESYAALWDMTIRDLPRLKVVKNPILVLGAEDDWLVKPNQIEKTAEAYNADCFIFQNMGHEMMLDTNWKAVAQKIIDWLKDIYPSDQ